MALNGNTLGTAIKNTVSGMTLEQKQNLEIAWQTIASVITSHIQTYLDAEEVNFDKTIQNMLVSTDVQDAIDEVAFGRCPIGGIIAWHKSFTNTPSLPVNWAECNGQTISESKSPYNGQALPNLNGDKRFLRGDSTSGTLQADAFQGHWHEIYVENITFTAGGSGASVVNTPNIQRLTNVQDPISDGINGTPRTASETRPVNMSVVWIIRIY